MGPGIQFILAIFVASTTLVSGSLAWPKFTTQPRPKLLQDVHDMAVKTSIGIKTAQVLGVSDEKTIEPVNFGEILASATGNLKKAVNDRIQTIIVGNAVNQLSRQYNRLPQDKKDQIQEIICKPPAP